VLRRSEGSLVRAGPCLRPEDRSPCRSLSCTPRGGPGPNLRLTLRTTLDRLGSCGRVFRPALAACISVRYPEDVGREKRLDVTGAPARRHER
jgi:hypothetical protein